MKMELCPFCRIVRGELPAYIVYEDDNCLAFLDERPLFPGHTLLVLKQHYETLLEVPQDLLVPLFSKVQLLAKAMGSGFGSDGAFVGINHLVSQRVPHLHIHVVPRRFNDGLRGFSGRGDVMKAKPRPTRCRAGSNPPSRICPGDLNLHYEQES